ncbi:MAG TPA: SoxR reducing system RseC family protein, partial [Clostridia bacterium]
MLELGKVTAVLGENVQVQFKRTSACDKCKLCSFEPGGTVSIVLKNELNAKAGDIVAVEILGKAVTLSYLIAFGIPALALVLGAIISSAARLSELYSILVVAASL